MLLCGPFDTRCSRGCSRFCGRPVIVSLNAYVDMSALWTLSKMSVPFLSFLPACLFRLLHSLFISQVSVAQFVYLRLTRSSCRAANQPVAVLISMDVCVRNASGKSPKLPLEIHGAGCLLLLRTFANAYTHTSVNITMDVCVCGIWGFAGVLKRMRDSLLCISSGGLGDSSDVDGAYQ